MLCCIVRFRGQPRLEAQPEDVGPRFRVQATEHEAVRLLGRVHVDLVDDVLWIVTAELFAENLDFPRVPEAPDRQASAVGSDGEPGLIELLDRDDRGRAHVPRSAGQAGHPAAAALPALVREGDVILVKGSQSIRTERIVEALLAHPADASKLVRQEKKWKQKV